MSDTLVNGRAWSIFNVHQAAGVWKMLQACTFFGLHR